MSLEPISKILLPSQPERVEGSFYTNTRFRHAQPDNHSFFRWPPIASLLIVLLLQASAFAQTIHVGAKHFTEGYILSEIISQILEAEGFNVKRHYNLGGTTVCFEALRKGEIDVYPEYSGTLSAEILKQPQLSYGQAQHELTKRYQLAVTPPYGFSNSYGLVMKNTWYEKGISKISDLKNFQQLSFGISYELLKRQDGWDNLAKHYQLSQQPVGLEHGLAYQALQADKIDVTDCYTTDGEIPQYNFMLLEDDLHFFPDYQATSLYRASLDERAIAALNKLSGKISEQKMQQMNAQVLFEKKTFAEVAASFLKEQGITSKNQNHPSTDAQDLVQKALRHLLLTFSALILAMLVAVPLGIYLYWHPRFASGVVYITGLLQTIPSIALLAILLPLFGIGIVPAVVALFLYALLPILRNTIAGLQGVDPLLKQVGEGLGMSRIQKMKWVEFPLALPVVLAGIRTAAVINVGTATLAAFIGAGGLGEYIVTGLALNNTSLILRGAIPAALLALVVEFGFEMVERVVVRKQLRN
ncbi:MAG: ABC transporter permease subunit [Cytophagales bacterium]|jgi:osmoprotectant transport system permease protein|nr:ABC transporter permease subunit [Cytophagales bacterium]